jgi:type II secretory pathway component GspD/PulD (secretin)
MGGGQGGGGGTLTVQQPIQQILNVTTTVSVPDGGTVLLGGVKRLREGRTMAGVPILNKIPYISRLFKNSGIGRETESLMLMVTPRIIIQEEEEELLGIPPE